MAIRERVSKKSPWEVVRKEKKEKKRLRNITRQSPETSEKKRKELTEKATCHL